MFASKTVSTHPAQVVKQTQPQEQGCGNISATKNPGMYNGRSFVGFARVRVKQEEEGKPKESSCGISCALVTGDAKPLLTH